MTSEIPIPFALATVLMRLLIGFDGRNPMKLYFILGEAFLITKQCLTVFNYGVNTLFAFSEDLFNNCADGGLGLGKTQAIRAKNKNGTVQTIMSPERQHGRKNIKGEPLAFLGQYIKPELKRRLKTVAELSKRTPRAALELALEAGLPGLEKECGIFSSAEAGDHRSPALDITRTASESVSDSQKGTGGAVQPPPKSKPGGAAGGGKASGNKVRKRRSR